ncbi:succinate dehydrogenase, cytochrome b556 subunit [Rhodobacterales bacterium HKCCA1288]|jgi:succinate dehydrogenase / fumarate reductase cytochrome b subunit|uniref:succinate dehydrogenase, cytochrome b556 subunit n=1 Tax=Roseovarius sp. 10 TaxID=3080563 RepID=UPI001937EBBB|nr:succinate dehydrogenase, cytochrome b556 subunit [Roseovarius sp. 10]MBF9057193.1 succinate dehydrogenase, cytochrome b556 subunit [Rhodobacterales bacterium HKCCA1065]MDV7201550.1 succinate dehydrogenase, cytochrome b556 subunit [Roseovarius sp. 10]QPI84350.1 succinate dehydrogenase, cytochrome b556 subunit [Rhodobacterales bacterium HKCCA1288]
MADVNRGNRPLSPHLQIYRKQLNSATSILNRITGIAMLGSALLIVWWLLAAATGKAYFDLVDGLMTSLLGDVVMTLSVLGLWYHTLGGLRHLIWDTGRGLELEAADRMGWAMIVGAVVLTILTLIFV